MPSKNSNPTLTDFLEKKPRKRRKVMLSRESLLSKLRECLMYASMVFHEKAESFVLVENVEKEFLKAFKDIKNIENCLMNIGIRSGEIIKKGRKKEFKIVISDEERYNNWLAQVNIDSFAPNVQSLLREDELYQMGVDNHYIENLREENSDNESVDEEELFTTQADDQLLQQEEFFPSTSVEEFTGIEGFEFSEGETQFLAELFRSQSLSVHLNEVKDYSELLEKFYNSLKIRNFSETKNIWMANQGIFKQIFDWDLVSSGNFSISTELNTVHLSSVINYCSPC